MLTFLKQVSLRHTCVVSAVDDRSHWETQRDAELGSRWTTTSYKTRTQLQPPAPSKTKQLWWGQLQTVTFECGIKFKMLHMATNNYSHSNTQQFLDMRYVVKITGTTNITFPWTRNNSALSAHEWPRLRTSFFFFFYLTRVYIHNFFKMDWHLKKVLRPLVTTQIRNPFKSQCTRTWWHYTENDGWPY